VRVGVPGGDVEAELEGDEDEEFGRDQIFSVQSKHVFDFLESEKKFEDLLLPNYRSLFAWLELLSRRRYCTTIGLPLSTKT